MMKNYQTVHSNWQSNVKNRKRKEMHAPKNRKGLLSRCYSFLPPPVIPACKCRCRTTVHREVSFSTRKHKRYPQPIIWIVAISMICSARLLTRKYRVFLQGQRPHSDLYTPSQIGFAADGYSRTNRRPIEQLRKRIAQPHPDLHFPRGSALERDGR